MPTDPNYRRSDYAWVDCGDGRKVYRKVVDHDPDRPTGPEVRVIPDANFVSHSLPRNYEIHKQRGGRFTEDGSVIIESRRQLEGLVREAQSRGEKLVYDGPGAISDPSC